MSDIHKLHRKRVKTEFLENGLAHFPNHKVLEMLLFYAIPRKDTNELGHLLIERFGSISGVFDASHDLLVKTPGVGEQAALLIKFTSSIIQLYLDDYSSINNVITDVQSAKDFMRYKYIGEQLECAYIACLGHNGKVIFCEKLAEGSPENVEITPSLVVKTALRANAAKVVLSHNHPLGICLPSTKDKRATNLFYDELHRVDIELFDHIIVAADGEYSMAENSMLANKIR